MMRLTTRFFWVLLGVLLAARAEAGGGRKPDNNDFILRAPAAEADAIAQRHGLQVVERLGPPAPGQGVRRVRPAPSADPEAVLQEVRAAEPNAFNVETLTLASVPE